MKRLNDVGDFGGLLPGTDENLDSCPSGTSPFVENLGVIESFGNDGLNLDFETLLMLTEGVEIGVTEDPSAPWPTAQVADLCVSSCAIELGQFENIMDLLAERAVGASKAIVRQGTPVSRRTLAVAGRILALHSTGSLVETLKQAPTGEDGLLPECYAD